LWCLVHIAKLIGVRNRLFVLASWAWSYLFFERIARLIVPRARDLGTSVRASEGRD
jgi:hypothetical protein